MCILINKARMFSQLSNRLNQAKNKHHLFEGGLKVCKLQSLQIQQIYTLKLDLGWSSHLVLTEEHKLLILIFRTAIKEGKIANKNVLIKGENVFAKDEVILSHLNIKVIKIFVTENTVFAVANLHIKVLLTHLARISVKENIPILVLCHSLVFLFHLIRA